MPVPNSSVVQYSTGIGLVYIFNLIVGTGALTLPAVFSRAGWLLGTLVILILALISFVTVTFVIESMAAANAITVWQRIQLAKRNGESTSQAESINSDTEDTPLVLQDSDGQHQDSVRYYDIQDKIEMGGIAGVLFDKFGISLFYICLCVYLYGDLSIYGAAIGKSMTDVACTYQPTNFTCNATIPMTETCWDGSGISRAKVYQLFLTTFVLLLGPFVFFDIKKTKYLQLLTTTMRWLAFAVMIIYALRLIVANGPQGSPPAFDWSVFCLAAGNILKKHKVFHYLLKKMHSIPKTERTKSMTIQVLPALSDNFMYLIIDPKSKEAAVVDPVDPGTVIDAVKKAQVNLTKILTTHHHWDHAGGNKEMCTRIDNLEVIGGDDRIEALTRKVSHDDTVNIGNLKVQCLATPCHTKGHMCYYIPGTDLYQDPPAVFTGDTLFIGGCGRFFEGTAEQMHRALNEILGGLPNETKVYCGHEYTEKNLNFAMSVDSINEILRKKLDDVMTLREKKIPTVPSTLIEEKLTNPFMRVNTSNIQVHYFTTDPVVTMAQLRADKDEY